MQKWFLIVGLPLFLMGSVQAQEKYRAIPWDVEQGLSLGAVHCMQKDINGFLWIGTAFGLKRFDGSHFTNYFADKSKRGTIIGSFILALIEDSLHNIWIGTHKGLSRYDFRADTFANFASPVDSTVTDPSTIPFWATSNEVFCIERHSQISAYDIHSFKRRVLIPYFHNDWDDNLKKPSFSIVDKKTNSVWMLAKAGLLQVILTTGRQVQYDFPCHRKVKFNGYWHSAEGMCYDQERNCIWLNTSDGLLQFNLHDKTFKYIDVFNKIVNKKPKKGSYYIATSAIRLDKAGRVWMGALPNGMLIYDPGKNILSQPFVIFENQNTIPDLYPDYLDRDGIIWASGRENFIYQLNPVRTAVIHYTTNTSKPFTLSNNHVATIVQGPQGKLWVGTWDGLNVLDPVTGSFQVWREKDLPGFKGKNIMPLAIDTMHKKAWLKAWPPDALFEMDIATRTCRTIIVNDTTANHNIDLGYFAAEKARPFKDGFIFPMQGAGIFTVAGGSLFARQVLNILQGIGRMIIAENHLFIYLPAAAYNRTYKEQNGTWLKIQNPLDSIEWSDIYFNIPDQTWWVGSLRQLIHCDKNFHVIRRYTDGFPGIAVLSMLADNYGNIWFVNAKGTISRLSIKTGTFISLSERDDFFKQKFEWDHAHVKDNMGDLYFGCDNGIYRIRPANLAENYPPSSVYIQSIKINQKPVTLKTGANSVQELKLKYNENNVDIETGIIDYYSEGSSRVRYLLEGVSKHWQYGTNHFNLYFNDLQPGSHRLIIQASNAVGTFNSREKILFIHILKPWWETWWFRGITAFCLAAVFYLIIRWRLHQKFRLQLERSEKEIQLAELRHKSSDMEMQALRAQMNPHFIFNCLNAINHFILNNEPEVASDYLTKFSRLIRMVLNHSQHSLIALFDDLECLELYIQLEQLRFQKHFQYTIRCDEAIDAEGLKIPPMLMQPFVENAIWHGLMHKDSEGELMIELMEKNEILYCTITDNGIGRKKAAELTANKDAKHKSIGLKITADRIASLHKLNAVPLTINDLVHADGSPAGTQVVIKIPLMQ